MAITATSYQIDRWPSFYFQLSHDAECLKTQKGKPRKDGAVLIGEDDKFWSHEGFDYEAIQKALEKDLKAKKI